jgi:hypothetical protein
MFMYTRLHCTCCFAVMGVLSECGCVLTCHVLCVA